MSTPEITDEVWTAVHAARRAARHVDRSDNWDAIYGLSQYALEQMLAVAYQAGRAAALNREEWRVCEVIEGHPFVWGVASDSSEARRDMANAVAAGWRGAWVERRRVGVSEWERVE